MYLIENLVQIYSAQHTLYAHYLNCFSINFMQRWYQWAEDLSSYLSQIKNSHF